MRKLNADPEFAAAHAERMRKLHVKRFEAQLETLDAQDRDCFDRCLADGLSHQEAMSLARDDMAIRKRVRMRGSAVLI